MRVRAGTAAVGWALLGALGCTPPVAPRPDEVIAADRWSLFAVEYARSEGVPLPRLVDAPDDGTTVDMSWLFYVALGFDRVVLLDAGHDFEDDDPRVESWRVASWIPVEDAVARLGVRPDDVTDVVLTHRHWDHVTGAARFDRADVRMLEAEWSVAREGFEPLKEIEDEGRFLGVDATPAEVLGGIVVEEGGHHTSHSAVVQVDCGFPALVLMDAAYLYRNVEEGLPVSTTTDPELNVAEVRAFAERVAAGGGLILPGHDPEVFERFPSRTEGVAVICE